MSKKKVGAGNPKKNTFKPMLTDAQKEVLKNAGSGLLTTFNPDTWKDEVKEFSNIKYLINDMKRRTQNGVDWVGRYIAISLGVAIEDWYNDYTPRKYVRTETLFNSVTIWRDNYNYEAHVSLGDYPNTLIPPYCEDGIANMGSAILKTAEEGLHGDSPGIGHQVGNIRIGIWGELISFLETGYWGATSGGTGASQSTLLNSSALDTAFIAGVRSGGIAPYGRNTSHIKGRGR